MARLSFSVILKSSVSSDFRPSASFSTGFSWSRKLHFFSEVGEAGRTGKGLILDPVHTDLL